MASSIFKLSSNWLHLGLVTERMVALYYYLVLLGETSLAQELRENVAVAKGKKYISLLRIQQYHF
jgi:hypothetical protein